MEFQMSDLSPALASAAERMENMSRRGLLGKAVLTGIAAMPVVGLLASTSQAAGRYQQPIDASAREAFTDIRLHENDHVALLKKILGSNARPKPKFKNLKPANFNAFVTLSRALENVGCGAYLAATPAISSKSVLATAASIALMEARHAGFLNVFSGVDVSRNALNDTTAFERPLTLQQVVNAASPYIASLNGGPPASFTAGNDTSILNFALLLEYLEAEYYNINVPLYF